MTDTSSVTIRPAERQDVAVIAVMAVEFNALLAAMDGSEPSLDVAETEAKLLRAGFGAKPLFSSILAEAKGEAVGYAIYSLGFWADSMAGMVLLTDLFVREGWRSRGIGQEIMDRLAEIGRDADCQMLMWTVWTENPAAQRFYERLGARAMDDERLMMLAI